MANVDVIISKGIITKSFASPIVPGATEVEPVPVNPDGLTNGTSTYIGLTDTDNSYLGKAGQIPIVNTGETGLEFGSVASATNHNDLAGIQGGSVGEYYHLTEDEHDAVLNTPNTPDALNPFATIADIGAMGGGTVTSVSLTAPSIFSVSGSPVTTSGTLGLSLVNQSGFTVFARESGTGTPSFQALLEGHIPAIPISRVTGLQSALNLKLGIGLVSGNIFVGNGSNIAAGVTLSLNATGGTFGLSNAGVLTFPNASGSARGLLTSADWTTFNNKSTLALGETSTTAYRGDRGKIAYDYSQIGHLPLTGGTLTGNLSLNNVNNRSIIFDLGAQIRSATGGFVISSDTGTGNSIVLRPNGDTTSTGQLRVNSDGTVDIGSNATSTTNAVRGDRTISSGTGLTGGGNLTSNRTLALTGQALALHNLATNGLIARTGAGTVAARTITAGTGISVSNGNGVSENPIMISLNVADNVTGSGADGQVSFWTGTNVISGGGLTWNNSTQVLSTVGALTLSVTGTNSDLLIETTRRLQVTGQIFSSEALAFSSNTTTPNLSNFIHRPSANTLAFGTSSLERMRITSGGDVLINTATALAGGGKLQVNGAVNCDDPTADTHAVTLGYLNTNLGALRTAGDTGIGALRYSGTTATSGQLYGGTTNPSSTTRLNYDGNFYVKNLFALNGIVWGNEIVSSRNQIVNLQNNGNSNWISSLDDYISIFTFRSITTTNAHATVLETKINGVLSITVLSVNNVNVSIVLNGVNVQNVSGSTITARVNRLFLNSI